MATGDEFTHVNKRLTCLEHCALHRRTIKLTCPVCGHVRRLDAVALWWMFTRNGWDDRLPGAYRRFCCQPCREGGRLVRFRAEITRERLDADQPPYPDETTWKRLVSRYRS